MTRRWLRVAAVVFAVEVAVSVPVSAHSDLRTSRPVDGQTIRTAITEVDLVFWSGVSQAVMAVEGPDGSPVAGRTSQLDEVTVRFSMAPTDVAGSYTVAYRLTSRDGDPVAGSIGFAYSPDAPSGITGIPVLTALAGIAIVIWLAARTTHRRATSRG